MRAQAACHVLVCSDCGPLLLDAASLGVFVILVSKSNSSLQLDWHGHAKPGCRPPLSMTWTPTMPPSLWQVSSFPGSTSTRLDFDCVMSLSELDSHRRGTCASSLHHPGVTWVLFQTLELLLPSHCAGGGGVALHVTRRLKNMGSWVWQLQRTDVRRKVRAAISATRKGLCRQASHGSHLRQGACL